VWVWVWGVGWPCGGVHRVWWPLVVVVGGAPSSRAFVCRAVAGLAAGAAAGHNGQWSQAIGPAAPPKVCMSYRYSK
jgi:hypothetical protein